MSSFPDRAKSFVEMVMHLFLIDRDTERLLSCFAPEISWFGTGAHEICRDKASVANHVRDDVASHPGAFALADAWYFPIVIASDSCCVMMSGKVLSSEAEGSAFLMNVRISWIVRQYSDGSLKIVHRHASVPNMEQVGDSFFPQVVGMQNFSVLQRLLQTKTAEIESFYNLLNGGVCKIALNADCTLLYANDYFFEMFGYCREDLAANGYRTIDYIYEEDVADVIEQTHHLLKTSKRYSLQYRIKHKDGSVVWIRLSAILSDEHYQGDIPVLYCIYVNITEFIHSYEQLALEKDRYRIITELTDGITFEYDFAADRIEFSNKYDRYFHFPPIIDQFKRFISRNFFITKGEYRKFIHLFRTVLRKRPKSSTELRMKIRDGSWNWFSISLYMLRSDQGSPIKIIGKMTDIHQQKHAQQELEHKSQLDPMTKLYNKVSAEHQIIAHLSSIAVDTLSALFVIDIDDFKTVNDTRGHFVGDHVISFIANQLSSIFRTTDIIGRFGGDEFIILMKDFYTESIALEKATLLNKVIANAYRPMVDGFQVSLSVGIAFVDGSRPLTYQQLFKRADKALYAAKNSGKNRYAVYDPAMENIYLAESNAHQSRAFFQAQSEVKNTLQFIDTILDFLLHTENTKDALNHSLKFMGDSLSLCQAYFGAYKAGEIEIAMQWSGPNTAPMPKRIELSKEEHLLYFNSDGVFLCGDTSVLGPPIRVICEGLRTSATLQCLICKNNCVIGFAGFNYCGAPRIWNQAEIDILQTVTKVITDAFIKVLDR